jgi:hypothetical protein
MKVKWDLLAMALFVFAFMAISLFVANRNTNAQINATHKETK